MSGFITYTDSETWAGNIHPAQALRQYRSEFVGDAKAVVVGMTSNGFTLADPNDRGMLDVVGFDTTVPGGHRGLCPFLTLEPLRLQIRRGTTRAGRQLSALLSTSRWPSSQAAVCKTAQAGAILRTGLQFSRA